MQDDGPSARPVQVCENALKLSSTTRRQMGSTANRLVTISCPSPYGIPRPTLASRHLDKVSLACLPDGDELMEALTESVDWFVKHYDDGARVGRR